MHEFPSTYSAHFGLLAAALGTLAFAPYILDVLAGRTRPQRSSWLIWAVVTSIAFAAQLAEGATQSLWFSGAQVLVTLTVFVLSMRWGQGHYLNGPDLIALLVSGCAVAFWLISDMPVIALACAIGINLLAGGLTLAKAYVAPRSETLCSWVLGAVASGFGLLSVGQMDLVLLAYPMYLFVLYASVALAIGVGRHRQRRGLQQSAWRPWPGGAARAAQAAHAEAQLRHEPQQT